MSDVEDITDWSEIQKIDKRDRGLKSKREAWEYRNRERHRIWFERNVRDASRRPSKG